MNVRCPNCDYPRLQLREWGTYSDRTPINEQGIVLIQARLETSVERAGYDVWCPLCNAVVPARLDMFGRVELAALATPREGENNGT